MTQRALIRKMVRYMGWADDVVLDNAARLSAEELIAPRDTLFGSISGTFDHILLVGEIFKAHLAGADHQHQSRHRQATRSFRTVADELRAMNRHYVDYADGLDDAGLTETIDFTFIGGGEGSMTRGEILLHLVNHATYHRGFVSTLIFPYRAGGEANDLTVFLRDAWPCLVRQDPSLAR